MLISELIDQAWKNAMKAKNPSKDVYSLIRTELKNRLISSRTKDGEFAKMLSNDETVIALDKMCKQRRDSVVEYVKCGRQDLADKESAEIKVIEQYLPARISDEELKEIIKSTAAEAEYTGAKDVGKLMKILMPRVKGRVDGKKIQEAVKEVLG